jgi:hypothetical protein
LTTLAAPAGAAIGGKPPFVVAGAVTMDRQRRLVARHQRAAGMGARGARTRHPRERSEPNAPSGHFRQHSLDNMF